MDFNSVWLSGKVMAEPIAGKTGNGIDALSFKMITKQAEQDRDTGKWFDRNTVLEYVLYGSLAKIAAAEIHRDDQVAVEGRLSVSTWDKGKGPQHRVQVMVEKYDVQERLRSRKVGA